MLEIIGFLLCLLLIFLGVLVLQLGLTGAKQSPTSRVVGWTAFSASILFAILFASWLVSQGDAVRDNLQRLP